jgi:hypothetical protein
VLNELATPALLFLLATSLFGLALVLIRLVGYNNGLLVFLQLFFVIIVEHIIVVFDVWLYVFQELVGLQEDVFEGEGGISREGGTVVRLV